MRLALAVLLLLLAPCGSLAAGVDLLDLNIAGSRVPTWYPFDETTYNAAQLWTEYDVTCENAPCGSGKQGYKDMAGNPLSACTAVTTTNFSGMQCMIASAIDESVLYIPAGTYEIDNGEVMGVGRSNLVVRGAGRASTILERTANSNENPASCDYGGGAWIFSACKDGASGTVTNWTAGYSTGDTTVTVDDSSDFMIWTAPDDPGGWIRLTMSNATACVHSDSLDNSHVKKFNHIAKVIGVTGDGPGGGADTVTFDRPLRMDYDGAGCTGWVAYPFTPIENVGLEDVGMTTSSAWTNHWNWYFSHVSAVNSWLVNSNFGYSSRRWNHTDESARIWYQGNNFDGLEYAISNNGQGMYTTGSTDIVWENNICLDAPICSQFFNGAEGTILAYNWFYQDNGSVPTVERALQMHAHYIRESLIEGNDVDAGLQIEAWYGRNGPRNTFYRNRNRSNSCEWESSLHSAIGTAEMRYATVDTDFDAELTNLIGNTMRVLGTGPGGTHNEDCSSYSATWDFNDKLQFGDDARTKDAWFEKNAYRLNTDAAWSDQMPAADANHWDRSCGVSLGDTCPGTNKGVSSPDVSWSGTYPTSLYRTSAPSWWCQEACAWDQTGIGAFGDDFGGTLCKLPAQIRYESGTCTALSTGSHHGISASGGVSFE